MENILSYTKGTYFWHRKDISLRYKNYSAVSYALIIPGCNVYSMCENPFSQPRTDYTAALFRGGWKNNAMLNKYAIEWILTVCA